ncbi:MAG TPA: hypothetical protein VFI91_07775 [Longimicrobiaceae bacterium]|nr:hypothetical protein [Longimicrobiaceae bacterium]
MRGERGVSALAIDLTRLHRRTVTSFYSNLVTRPTGQAIRMGVESQIADLDPSLPVCLSVLDFSQVRVLDYSCADEIVAKLLLRYATDERPGDAYFVVRGLQEEHREAIEAVLERHNLLLVADAPGGAPLLLGPANPFERACWAVLRDRGAATAVAIAEASGMAEEAATSTCAGLVARRVAVVRRDGAVSPLSSLINS